MSYLLYHSLKALYPASSDFIDMGLGISARHARCRSYWRGHLDNSKNFQIAAVKELCVSADWGGRITVLGSGRLFDVPLKQLLSLSSRVSLYDGDPGAIVQTRIAYLRYLKKLSVNCVEITGVLQSWSEQLVAFLRHNKSEKNLTLLSEFLDRLSIQKGVLLNSSDLMISLNLLSQIPLYWRDRVFLLILKYWGIELDHDSCENPLKLALENSMCLLQQDHLRLLSESKSKRIVLITDTHFNYYQQDRSHWLVHDALYLDPEVELAQSYTLSRSSSWLWHIAPQGIEQQEYGVIHTVKAMEFSVIA